ncbi:MAG: flagellar motor switch protein FliM [Paracoccaceae bacterium]|jgi:flagellar motor switch protein FliM
MTTEQTGSAVQRKLAAASNGPQTGERTAMRALRLGFARAAASVCELPLAVLGATQRRTSSDEVANYIRDDWLLLLLDGSEGQIGAMLFDPNSIAALIQHQTMGAVSGGATDDRAFTETDAAMVAPLVDAMLTKARELVQVPMDALCLGSYCFGARSEDARSLALTLEADHYRVFELALDFTGGIVQGAACLILPEPPEPKPTKSSKNRGPRMDRAVGGASAEINAVICRMRITLAELSAMTPGDVVPLTTGQFNKTELLTLSGQRITTGQLGQASGFRAIRLAGYMPQLAAKSDDFESSLGLPAPEAAPAQNSMILDGTVLADVEPADQLTALLDDDTDALFAGLSESEAALEISELAGLPLPNAAKNQKGKIAS